MNPQTRKMSLLYAAAMALLALLALAAPLLALAAPLLG